MKKLLKNKKVAKLLLKFFINLHNYCYNKISILVVFASGGLHPKHEIMNYHQFFVDNSDKDDVILDLGCGNGFLTFDVSRKVKKIIGIDNNIKNIEVAQKNYQAENIEFLSGDATRYEFGQNFDKIILSNVLEHIENRVDFLKKLHDLSDVILLRVPLIDRDWLTVYKKNNNYEYRLDKTHFIEYTLNTLNQELSQSGWKLKDYSIQFGELWGVVEK